MITGEASARIKLIERPMAEIACQIDAAFHHLLVEPDDPSSRLVQAMRYAAIGGGKRLRPLLACASADLFGVPRSMSLRAGLAVECVHVHSLIHDDLPCMDDDDLRRGKPTVHLAYDEATAVLAGDSLLAMAFEILCDPLTHPSGEVRAQLARDLAFAAGAYGMAGGQMLDLEAEGRFAGGNPLSLAVGEIERLQGMKTGALLAASCEAGAILGRAGEKEREALTRYARYPE